MKTLTEEINLAEKRLRHQVRETLLDYSIAISRETGVHLFLKCENLQITGSFKVRGALNKLLSLTSDEASRGIIAASSGNHGAAVAYGLHKLKLPGIIFVPQNAASTKVENIRNFGIPIKFYGDDCVQTELHARQYAEQHHMLYISPYNDMQVIAGQATLAGELLQQLPQIDAIFVPVGGGGLIAGIATLIKTRSANTRIIGCLPENSPVMAASIKAGHVVDMETLPTLSDATAGGIEPDAITFALCQKYVDDFCLVSEEQIKNALITLLHSQHLLVEGAAAVALAAAQQMKTQFHNKNVVVILSGANISLSTLKKVLDNNENNKIS